LAVLGSVIGGNTPAVAGSTQPTTYAGDYQGGASDSGTFIEFSIRELFSPPMFVVRPEHALPCPLSVILFPW